MGDRVTLILKTCLAPLLALTLAGALAANPLTVGPATLAPTAQAARPTVHAPTALEAFERLKEGNDRFVTQRAQRPRADGARMAEVANGQVPFAIVLACADSRVPPEVLFDQGIGDLFVVRVAGNVVTPHVLGSIEYAVEHLGTNLIVVLGHERCGAVSAACELLAEGRHGHGNVQAIVTEIEPAVRATPGQPLDATIDANVRQTIARMMQESDLVREKTAAGILRIVGARYDLDSGEVTYLRR